MVEQEAVNFEVVSSSLTGGAIFLCYYFYMRFSVERSHKNTDLDQRDPEHIGKISKENSWGSLASVPFAGEKTVSTTEEMREALASLPDDVDDEIKQAVAALGGQNTERENDIIKKRDDVVKAFEQMDAVSAFGRSARQDGRGRVERSPRPKEDLSQEELDKILSGDW